MAIFRSFNWFLLYFCLSSASAILPYQISGKVTHTNTNDIHDEREKAENYFASESIDITGASIWFMIVCTQTTMANNFMSERREEIIHSISIDRKRRRKKIYKMKNQFNFPFFFVAKRTKHFIGCHWKKKIERLAWSWCQRVIFITVNLSKILFIDDNRRLCFSFGRNSSIIRCHLSSFCIRQKSTTTMSHTRQKRQKPNDWR